MQSLSKGPRDTITLSRGKVFQAKFKQRTPFPAGASGTIAFFDLAGGVLATFDAYADDRTIYFEESADDHDAIPAGSVFEFSITDPAISDPIPISHGEVVREEAYFPYAAPTVVDDPARQFSDNFSSIVSRRWVRLAGQSSLEIHTNGGGLPNSMGPSYNWTSSAACLWYAPMSMDSVTVTVHLVQTNPWLTTGYGQFNVVVCSTSDMSSYLAINFQTGYVGSDNAVRVITGNDPFTGTVRASTPHAVSSLETYTIKYNALSNTVACYLDTDLTPLVSWTDTGNVVHHGSPANRYTGMAFYSNVFTPSVEVTAWEAHDGL